MGTYVIAVKRDQRAAAPPDWKDRLAGIEGLAIQGSQSPYRIQVTASEDAVRTARSCMGDLLHIEPILLHQRLSIR